MRQLLYFAFFVLTTIGLAGYTTASKLDRPSKFHQDNKARPMGISIVLYRVGKSDKIEDLSNLEKQMNKSRSVNLYKITQDLGIIFMNAADPYSDTAAVPYKMLFGTYVEKHVGDRIINGFVSTLEVATICDWIKKHRIDNFEIFLKMYDILSKEAKQQLKDISTDDAKNLFSGYVQPLTQFYFAALKDNNSIVICGE